MAWLVCIRGSDKGLQIELSDKPLVMGRAPDSDLQIVDQRSSRYHCKVFEFRGKMYVEDMESTNGIKYQGKRYKGKKVKLKEGETFSIGADVFEYTSKHDSYVEASEDLVKEYGHTSNSKMVEKTFSDALDSGKASKKKRNRFSLFSFLKKKAED